MNWREICRLYRSVPKHKRAAALADASRAWADLYHGNLSEFEDVCEFIAESLEVQAAKEPGEVRAREARRGWVIIDNVARREGEQDLYEAGIIEDPSLDGGLNG